MSDTDPPDSRLARLEAKFDALTEKVSGLTDAIKRSGRPDWQALAAWATVLLVIGGAAVAAVVTPMQSTATELAGKVDENASRIAAHDSRVEAMLEKFQEIETQFAWADDLSAREREMQWSILSMLWRKTYHETFVFPPNYQHGPSRSRK